MNKRGFTLTEVLIALSIIGFIAAMTLPNLIVSTGNKKVKTTIQKFLADMNQAIKLYEMDHGSIMQANVASQANAFANVMVIKSKGLTTRPNRYPNGGATWGGTAGYQYLKLGNNSEIIFNNDLRTIAYDIDGNSQGANTYGSDVFIFYIYPIGGASTLMPYGYSPNASSYPTGYNHAAGNWENVSGVKCTAGSGFGYGCAQYVLDTY
jgi:prepilin-type N-terminal cleavage/methylation domain-containing protein